MNEFHFNMKLPKGVGWLIGSIIGFIVWVICTFILTEVGWFMGMLLAIGGMVGFAIPIESLNREPLTPQQQKQMTLIGIILTISFSISLVFFIFMILT